MGFADEQRNLLLAARAVLLVVAVVGIGVGVDRHLALRAKQGEAEKILAGLSSNPDLPPPALAPARDLVDKATVRIWMSAIASAAVVVAFVVSWFWSRTSPLPVILGALGLYLAVQALVFFVSPASISLLGGVLIVAMLAGAALAVEYARRRDLEVS